MLLYHASFRKLSDVPDEVVEDRVLTYIGALLNNGQAYGDYQYGWQNDELVVIIHIPTAGAINPRHHSKWGAKAYKEAVTVLRQMPEWRLLATDRNRSCASVTKAPFLYLFSNALTLEPPVRCGHNGEGVPTFRLPLDSSTREELYFWFNSYADHDSMWLESGVLEKAAYRQLSDPDSELSKSGRELCARIETATRKPTYYYLLRYHGLKRKETQRPCPGCAKAWQAHPQREGQPFWEFHFRCDSCRLVSHCAAEG